MAKKIKVIITEIARRDLEEARDYIQFDSPRAARKLIQKIRDRLEMLPRFPRSGRIIPEIGDPLLRYSEKSSWSPIESCIAFKRDRLKFFGFSMDAAFFGERSEGPPSTYHHAPGTR